MDGGVTVLVRQPCLIPLTWKAQPYMRREELAEHCQSCLGLSNPWHPGTESSFLFFCPWVWLLLPICPKQYFWSLGNTAALFGDKRIGYTCKPAGYYIRWERNLAMSTLAFDSLDFAWNLSSGAGENSSHLSNLPTRPNMTGSSYFSLQDDTTCGSCVSAICLMPSAVTGYVSESCLNELFPAEESLVWE